MFVEAQNFGSFASGPPFAQLVPGRRCDGDFWRFWGSQGNQWLQPMVNHWLSNGKLTVCYGKSPFLIGKSTISMGHFQ